jgi:multiple sugar transport system permease protein
MDERMPKRKWLTPYLMLLPMLLGLLILVYFPLLSTLFLSFVRYFLNKPNVAMQFVGIRNYIGVFSNTDFWQAFKNTLIFMVFSTSFSIFLGLGAAILFNRDFPGKNVFLSLVLLPMMVAPVASALCWKFLFDGQWGAVNYFVQLLGGAKQAWLADPRFALFAVAVADVWLYLPFVFLVLYTSLQVIPGEPLEAALIDGATGWQIFIRVIFPLLVPSFVLILIIRLVDTLRVFDLVYVMTNGGPGGRTATLGFLSYEWIFRHFNMGRGSVVTIFILGSVILISWHFIRVLQSQFLEQAK